MTTQPGRRFWFELSMAIATGLLAVVTAAWREWIELVFRVDPDGGSGALEWGIVLALLCTCCAAALSARVELRRLHTAIVD